MQYAQLNTDGSYSHQITTSGNIAWGPNHFCPASALTATESMLFNVVPLLETEPPTINRITQTVMRDGSELVDGLWQYKWRVAALTPEQVAANISAAQAALQATIIAATQARLDAFASTRNYDGILSACTYATSGVPQFAAEGQAAVNARDATWATLYTVLGEVQAGTRPVPTGFADIEGDLPALVWPE